MDMPLRHPMCAYPVARRAIPFRVPLRIPLPMHRDCLKWMALWARQPHLLSDVLCAPFRQYCPNLFLAFRTKVLVEGHHQTHRRIAIHPPDKNPVACLRVECHRAPEHELQPVQWRALDLANTHRRASTSRKAALALQERDRSSDPEMVRDWKWDCGGQDMRRRLADSHLGLLIRSWWLGGVEASPALRPTAQGYAR
jgi:hypothetical protein